MLFSHHRALQDIHIHYSLGKDCLHRSEDCVGYSDWPEDGTKKWVCIIHQAIQTNVPWLAFNCQISLACVWFEHINFPSLSHLRSLLSLSLRMVCSEHHRPRGMCACLAIINMSYTWADRQNTAQSHILQTFDLIFIILWASNCVWLVKTINHLTRVSLRCCRKSENIGSCFKCSGCCTK